MTDIPKLDESLIGKIRDSFAHTAGNFVLETVASEGYRREFRTAVDYGMKAASHPNTKWKPTPEFSSFSGHQEKTRDKVAENIVFWLLSNMATEYYGKMVIGSLAYGMSAMMEDLIDGIDDLR